MTPADLARQKFNADFHRILGQRLNRPVPKTYTDALLHGLTDEDRRSASSLFYQPTKNRSSSSTEKAPRLTEEQLKQEKLEALTDNVLQDDRGGLRKAWDAVTFNPLSAGKRLLSIVSRPGYTVTNAMYRGYEALEKDKEPIWSIGDDIAYGAWRGLSGKDTKGYGDVIELNPVAKEALPLNVKRGLGITGDILFDPLTYVTGGTVKAAVTASKAGKVGKEVAAAAKAAKAAEKTPLNAVSLENLANAAASPRKIKVNKAAKVMDDDLGVVGTVEDFAPQFKQAQKAKAAAQGTKVRKTRLSPEEVEEIVNTKAARPVLGRRYTPERLVDDILTNKVIDDTAELVALDGKALGTVDSYIGLPKIQQLKSAYEAGHITADELGEAILSRQGIVGKNYTPDHLIKDLASGKVIDETTELFTAAGKSMGTVDNLLGVKRLRHLENAVKHKAITPDEIAQIVTSRAGYQGPLTGGEIAQRVAYRIHREGVEKAAREATPVVGQESIVRNTQRAVKSALQAQKISDPNLVDNIVNEVVDPVRRMHVEITGGAQRGKVIGGKETISTVANNAAESFRLSITRRVSPMAEAVYNAAKKKGRIPSGQHAKWRADDDAFKVWDDAFSSEMTVSGKADRAAVRANQALDDYLKPFIEDIHSKVTTELADAVRGIPTLRMLGKDIAYFPKTGDALHALTTKVKNVDAIRRATKIFSYTSNFPGMSTFLGQKVRALGNVKYQALRRQVIEQARDTTVKERHFLQRALETGIRPADPRMGAKYDFLRQKYDEMFDEELAAGVMSSAAKKINNYSYVYFRTYDQSKVKAFKTAKDATIARTNSFGQYTSDLAAKQGLKPEMDAFRNLLLRGIKSNRRLTRQYFKKDLVYHYGFKSNMSNHEARIRGLHHMQAKDLPDGLGDTLQKGERFFIDKDINEIYNNYVALTKVGNEDAADVFKVIDLITRKFKSYNTIYWPGFHIRNFISDMYLGLMDGVRYKHYVKVFRNWDLSTGTPKPGSYIDLGGQTVSYDKLYNAYVDSAASGGFLNAELKNRSKYELSSKGFVEHLRHPTGIPSGIRRFSENREDFGRFVHFYKAMSDEYPKYLQKGYSKEKAWEEALNASLFRVNKYKFDYGALTRVEQRGMRRGMPFYTYTRKAIPTLVESIYLSPRTLSYTDRLFNALVPGGSDQFTGMQVPQIYQDLGFATLPFGDEENPWGILGSFLPQNTAQDIENPVSNLNPMIRVPFELSSGRAAFSGQKVENPMDVLLSNYRGYSTYRKTMDGNVPFAEKLAFLLGIPLVQLTDKRKDSAVVSMEFKLRDNIRELDQGIAADKGLSIYYSKRLDGISIRIKDLETNQILGDYPTLKAAEAALRQMR